MSQDSLQPLNLVDLSEKNPNASREYLEVPAIRDLVSFFKEKGLKALKQEDRKETWYQDWVDYNTQNGIYASLLSPQKYSSRGSSFQLLNLVRFVEAFGSCSPAHGYSFQVTFLGIFPILMSSNEEIKKEAVASLEAGGLFAFGVSEKTHGSDLYSNEMQVKQDSAGNYVAKGKKYYIGNANCASMISTLGRVASSDGAKANSKEPFVFFALRQGQAKKVKKIPTLGVRAAFVGGFDVDNYKFTDAEVISRGKQAWDAVFGTVNLGKFLLGFGSVGICERAFTEALDHTRGRILFGQAVFQMPHIQSALVQAYTRLCAMKLYAYRAADYLQVASGNDRRYLLFNSVQKARVSTEGVRVMELLSECVGARGFESETYFEAALRDALLIPGLEGSTHINFGLTAKFMKNFFFGHDLKLDAPPSMATSQTPVAENPELMRTRAGDLSKVRFGDYRSAFAAHAQNKNVKVFSDQVKALRTFALAMALTPHLQKDADFVMALGKLFSVVAYGQLIAENAELAESDTDLVSMIFHYLIEDLSAHTLKALSLPQLPMPLALLLRRVIASPKTSSESSARVAELMVQRLSTT